MELNSKIPASGLIKASNITKRKDHKEISAVKMQDNESVRKCTTAFKIMK